MKRSQKETWSSCKGPFTINLHPNCWISSSLKVLQQEDLHSVLVLVETPHGTCVQHDVLMQLMVLQKGNCINIKKENFEFPKNLFITIFFNRKLWRRQDLLPGLWCVNQDPLPAKAGTLIKHQLSEWSKQYVEIGQLFFYKVPLQLHWNWQNQNCCFSRAIEMLSKLPTCICPNFYVLYMLD